MTRIHQKTSSLITLFIVVAALLSACDSNDVYYQFNDVKDASWSKHDTLKFVVDTTSIVPGVAYDVWIESVNSSKYAYQNLWLFVSANVDSRKTFQQDTVQLKLADDYGKWLGSGFGSFYQVSTLLKKGVVFSQKRNYLFRLVQGMRDEPLNGIEKIGLKISRAQ